MEFENDEGNNESSNKNVEKKVEHKNVQNTKPGSNVIGENSLVGIHYVGTFDDGKVFDSVKEKVFKFRIGSNAVLKSFENALIGMKKGDTKRIRLKPEEAYGLRNEALVVAIPKNTLEGKVKLEPGKHLVFTTPDGSKAYAEIKEIKGDDVILDLNHPLAGKALNFDVEIVSVEE